MPERNVFSYRSTNFNIEANARIAGSHLFIKIGSLNQADFKLMPGQAGHKIFASHVNSAAVLGFKHVKQWRLPIDKLSGFHSACYAIKDVNEVFSSKIRLVLTELSVNDRNNEDIWNSVLIPEFRKIKDEMNLSNNTFEKILFIANPAKHTTKLHPHAEHFINDVWPLLCNQIHTSISGK